MTSYTNLSQNMNFTTIGDLLNHANTMTEGIFWTAMYWMLVVVVFIVTTVFGFEVSLILSFFFGLIVGIFFVYMGLISIITFGISEAVLLFFMIYFMYTSNKNQ